MKQEQDKWEKLIHLSESYEPNPDLADKVIEKISQKESTAKSKKPKMWWTGIAACFVVCCVSLAIFLPVYFRTPEDIYFSENRLEYLDIGDIDEFVQDNQLQIHYYSYDTVTTRCTRIIEDNKLAYLMQDMIYVGETGFDMVNLRVVLMQHAIFDFYENYNSPTSEISCFGISVDYSVAENNSGNNYKAKFSYKNYDYYLEIKTSDSGTGVLEKYVDLLLN